MARDGMPDDRVEAAKLFLDRIGGFRGEAEEFGVVACAEALISIAEDVRAIRNTVTSEHPHE